jgi:F0F1-type ATP synthase membrane subunit b/b'
MKDIILVFYFAYWLIYNLKPFSIWILIIVYILASLFLAFVTGVIDKSADVIKEKSKYIETIIKEFDKRLKKLEKSFLNSTKKVKDEIN